MTSRQIATWMVEGDMVRDDIRGYDVFDCDIVGKEILDGGIVYEGMANCHVAIADVIDEEISLLSIRF